ncbi:MAG TPA: SDR family oxidoreductase [Actinomycetota bacterium]|nr:SDR family oxidoreductase [Actinomycetota bacterium]
MSPQVAFVTGAASGLGLAIARRLAGNGTTVVVADVDTAAGPGAAEELGNGSFFVECDVSDLDAVRDAVARTRERAGGIDVLVNNAGFDLPGFFLQTDPGTWRSLIAVNLEGVLNCTFVIAPLLIEGAAQTGYARIVNVASDAGRVGSSGEAVYSAAKGGVIAFSKSTARELARYGITVNAVCPGPADTPMTAAIRQTEIGEKMFQKLQAATPLKRLVKPDEVAAAVEYFLTDAATFVTGQVLSVSGGLTMSG